MPSREPYRPRVKGIEHGLTGYTNHGCRCKVCTEANREHAREYRRQRHAGRPLCIVPNCPRVMAQSRGNGFCYKHSDEFLEMRETDPAKARRIGKKLGLKESMLPAAPKRTTRRKKVAA